MTTDHKSVVAIFKEDVASLWYKLQRIELCILQCIIRILHKLRLQAFIAHLLSRQKYEINRDDNILGMSIKSHTNLKPYEQLSMLSDYVFSGWPSVRAESQEKLQ